MFFLVVYVIIFHSLMLVVIVNDHLYVNVDMLIGYF